MRARYCSFLAASIAFPATFCLTVSLCATSTCLFSPLLFPSISTCRECSSSYAPFPFSFSFLFFSFHHTELMNVHTHTNAHTHTYTQMQMHSHIYLIATVPCVLFWMSLVGEPQ